MPYIQGESLVITGHDRVYGRTNDGYGPTSGYVRNETAYIPNETDSLSDDGWNDTGLVIDETTYVDPGFYIDPPSQNSSYGRFGDRVAVGDGVIAVAQNEYDHPSYSGSPTFYTNQGRLHLYDYEGNLIKSIDNPDAAGSDESYWPRSLAIAGGRIFAGSGAIFNSSVMSGTEDEGAVYIFSLSGELLKTIYAPVSGDFSLSSKFGEFMDAGDGRLVITAWNFDSDNFLDGKGAMFIYDYNGNFIRQVNSVNNVFEDWFGYGVAVGSGRIAVVANAGFGSTQVRDIHIFDLDGNLLNTVTGHQYFNTLAIGDGRIVLGSKASSQSRASILDLDGDAWIYQKHIASGGQVYNTGDLADANNISTSILTSSDFFGAGVAVGNGRVWVGAPNNDTSANGSSTGVADLGAVYEFTDYGKFIAKHVPTDGQGGRVDAELGDTGTIACAPGIVAFGASGYSSDTGRVYVYRGGGENPPWGSTTHMLNVFDR